MKGSDMASKKKEAIRCTVLVNNRWGYVATPMDFPSVRSALRYVHSPEASGWFAYRIVVNGEVFKRGNCYDYI